jgi:hypothetical protein
MDVEDGGVVGAKAAADEANARQSISLPNFILLLLIASVQA